MKNTINKILIYILVAYIVAIALTSCSTVQKLFHKEKHQSDSTSVIHERKDSTASKDSTVLRKKSEESGSETVINWGDTSIYIPFKDSTTDGGIYIYPKNPDDYFRFDVEKRTIISNKVPKSIVIKENSKIAQEDALLVHSQISKSERKDDSSRVKTKDKDVQNSVHKSRFPVIPVTIAGLIVALALFLFFYIRRKKKQILAAAKLIIPPPGL